MTGADATRIAMWSGPRNISTAMMYAFAARADCAVWDEPFYACYLNHTGLGHPMRGEIIAGGEKNWDKVVDRCTGPVPDGRAVFYQKHMAHHMQTGRDWSWTGGLANVFLIRAPERVLASYARKRSDVTLDDIGFVRQAELFDYVCQRTGQAPLVLDTDDILANPECVLSQLCASLGIPFDGAMLSWPAGPKACDGVWASHWYGGAWRSTGFAPPPAGLPVLPDELQKIADAAQPAYEKLKSAIANR